MSSSPLLAGRFEFRDFLAEGAMETVYRGYDHQDGVLVAIKHLKKDIIDTDPVIIERFRKEGEVLNRLNHPNIVRMIAAVEAANERYLVMDYIQGGSLRTYLERGTQLDLGWLLHIAIELSDALARAHYLNIIHRDLKPDNVLLAD